MGPTERHECPADFQQILTDIYGVNRYGDPLYRVVWGQSEFRRVSKVDGGYENQSIGGNLAAWLIQRWTPPEKWGSRSLFNMVNKDPANNQVLFPYPEFGQYETIHNLGSGQLDYGIFHSLMPFLEEITYMSEAEIKAFKERQKQLENDRDVETITDRLMDALPTRYGPTSYGRGGCRTSVLDKKMAEIQQVWNSVDHKKLKHVRGMSQKPL
jgi:hypothetical protein